VLSSVQGYRARMDDTPHANEDPAEVEDADADVDVADVSGGAVPEQLLDDPQGAVEPPADAR